MIGREQLELLRDGGEHGQFKWAKLFLSGQLRWKAVYLRGAQMESADNWSLSSLRWSLVKFCPLAWEANLAHDIPPDYILLLVAIY